MMWLITGIRTGGPWVDSMRNMLTAPCGHRYKTVFNVLWLEPPLMTLRCILVSFSPELCITLHFLHCSRNELYCPVSCNTLLGLFKPLIGGSCLALCLKAVCLRCPMSMMFAILPRSQRVTSLSNTIRLQFQEGHWESVPTSAATVRQILQKCFSH